MSGDTMHAWFVRHNETPIVKLGAPFDYSKGCHNTGLVYGPAFD